MEAWVSVIAAIVTGIASIAAVVITTRAGNREITHKLETNQAVTDTKLQALTDAVKEGTSAARDMPVVKEQIKQIDHRVDDLERWRESCSKNLRS